MKRCVESPLGTVIVECDGEKVTGVYFTEAAADFNCDNDVLDAACREVEEYLSGERSSFSVPFKIEGTDFEKKVLLEICRIPYGETRSYSQIAEKAGSPRAVRAVGAVCAKNKILLMIPCHRVLKADGGISGYSGGIDRKRRLIKMEKSK